MGKVNRIIVHHTAVGGNQPQLNGVNEYHRQQDFPQSSLNYFVGYTYFIEKDGTLIQTRTDIEEQAHTKGFNFDSIGICLAGNFDVEIPTNAQLISLKNLILRKMTEWAILPNQVLAHRNFANKSCPGKLISDSQIKDFFQPDRGYFVRLLESLKQQLMNLKPGKVVGCIDK